MQKKVTGNLPVLALFKHDSSTSGSETNILELINPEEVYPLNWEREDCDTF